MLRKEEIAKIACGRVHFKTIGVDFDDTESLKYVLEKLTEKAGQTV